MPDVHPSHTRIPERRRTFLRLRRQCCRLSQPGTEVQASALIPPRPVFLAGKIDKRQPNTVAGLWSGSE